ncbi:MAG: DUF262 domain-containing protein [Phycisphaerae bacterium]|nr:DUF262 domain-containing protein [Phycisphaerae bacterium]
MQISTILDQIDLGAMALPEFQRGYVWNRDQVRGLMHSLYYKHPVGSLLVWVTKTEAVDARGDGVLTPGSVKLILDGQQRVTSLYGILRAKPPKFFEGNEKAFMGLYFNLEEEVFEFYAPTKMKDNSLWISVTELMQTGPAQFMQRIFKIDELSQQEVQVYINRINAISSIKDIDLHIEEVTGKEKTVDIVVDIFNRVNSGGTKLSKGDLALAKICASWPDARDQMNQRLQKWRNAGFRFKLDWLLRIVNTTVTGEALFTALKDVDPTTFKTGLHKAEKLVDTLLNIISRRLGLDHDRVLGSRASFALLARYISQNDKAIKDYKERDRLLYWYIHTFLWGRYSGSTESTLSRDLSLIRDGDGALDMLIDELRRHRGNLSLNPDDFSGWSKGARFYPLLYMMTRVHRARDWDSGIELSNNLLGKLNDLQIHHIFPKKLLREHGYSRPQINAIANFTFITQETNLRILAKQPSEYLEKIEARHPGVLSSHWIPMDRELWRVENYQDFIAARRELLAQAANEFLETLYGGGLPEKTVSPDVSERQLAAIPGSIDTDEEEQLLNQCNRWVIEQGLSEGELGYDLTDGTSQLVAILDLAWPNGLQEGLSQPVALLVDEGKDTEEAANSQGYRYFTSVEDLKRYVSSEILRLEDKEQTTPAKWSNWDDALKTIANKAIVDFYRTELDAGRENRLNKMKLYYRFAGRRCFSLTAHKKAVYVWQKQRFPDDEAYWNKKIGEHIKIEPVKEGTALRFYLSETGDFEQFLNAINGDLQKVEFAKKPFESNDEDEEDS